MNQREPTRTREHGTRVTKPKSGAERLAALKQIVSEWQYAKIDGIMVDGFTASAIVKVYDAINDKNKARFAGLHVARMAKIAFELLRKQEGS